MAEDSLKELEELSCHITKLSFGNRGLSLSLISVTMLEDACWNRKVLLQVS